MISWKSIHLLKSASQSLKLLIIYMLQDFYEARNFVKIRKHENKTFI